MERTGQHIDLLCKILWQLFCVSSFDGVTVCVRVCVCRFPLPPYPSSPFLFLPFPLIPFTPRLVISLFHVLSSSLFPLFLFVFCFSPSLSFLISLCSLTFLHSLPYFPSPLPLSLPPLLLLPLPFPSSSHLLFFPSLPPLPPHLPSPLRLSTFSKLTV